MASGNNRQVPLAPFTTLGLGGPAARFHPVTSVAEVIETVAAIDSAGGPLLLIAGGSNLVISDDGFGGDVVWLNSSGVQAIEDGGAVLVTAAAGHSFDALVAYCCAHGFAGVECLSGIPGSVGATPIQNVGAYGQEIAETVRTVQAWDRHRAAVVELSTADCEFSYRDSLFKHTDRFVVLSVTFALTRSPTAGPVRFGELSRELGDAEAKLETVRAAVLRLRRRKGMVIDPADPDTRSAGSFFTNPQLPPDQFAAIATHWPALPHWSQSDGRVKVPAAWLIEQAGFAKGYGHDGVAISSKHTLALTNKAGTTAALLELAREIRAGVADRFGITLVNEPVLVGVEL